MAEAVPSPDEIMAIVHDILKFAVQRRGESELNRPPEGELGTADFYASLRQQYSWIVDAFAQALALAPDPSRLEPLIDTMRVGENRLTGGAELHLANVDINGNITYNRVSAIDPFWSSVNGVQAKVADWTGDAADNFRGKFLAYLGVVPANQAMVFRALNLAMLAGKKVYEQYLRDVKELATVTRAALHPTGCHPPSLQAVIGIAAAVSKVLLGVVTLEDGAGAFEATAGVLELATVAAESGKEHGGEKYTVEGADVEAVLGCTDDLLQRIMALLGDCERDLVEIIEKDGATVNAGPSYVIPKPSVVDLSHKPVSSYHHEFD